MNVQQTLDTAGIAQPAQAPHKRSARPDDKAMLRAARDLVVDLSTARAGVYWPDMLLSAAIGYGALAGAILTHSVPLAIALGVVSALALYRALLFIHELTHIHRDALPGFRLAWNLLVGITRAPAMAPWRTPNTCRWR